jgi:tetratricopeptide (TPR) repeat protein
MLNQVLWTIDNELDGMSFERLCIDLLYRNGHREIVPIEPQDGGRDAEEFPRQGRGCAGEAAFFQFSKEKDWRSKLRRVARRLADRGGSEFSILVFVTNQKARGIDVDSFRTELLQNHGWKLIVYSREWLRLQLEEAHPDLAKKYLGIEVPAWPTHLSAIIQFKKPTEAPLSGAWVAFEAKAYERAAVELKDFLNVHPESVLAWQALAWSQYCVYHYDEALASINRALKLEDDRLQGLLIRACILAEKGIKEKNIAAVHEAASLFRWQLESAQDPTWQLFYNLGNVSSALGDHQNAISDYKQALKLESCEPTIWKNLASAYHLVGDHRSEMECFNKALDIDPLQPEALVSKGVSLLVDFQRPKEAAALIEHALKSSPDWAVQWPHIWYWLAKAHHEDGDLRSALRWAEDGLAHQPGHMGLNGLMSEIFAGLATKDSYIIEKVRSFWKSQIAQQPLDYLTRSRLAGLEMREGNESAAWDLLEKTFDLVHIHTAVPLRNSRFKVDECIEALQFLPQYVAFRNRCPVSEYWNRSDPLYDLPFEPPTSDCIMDALVVFLAIPFGQALKCMEEVSDKREKSRSLKSFFEFLRLKLEHALIEASQELACLIPSKNNGVEATAQKVTEIIMFLGLIALREFGRQRGWIATQFRISSEALNRALEDYDESQIERNVMAVAAGRLLEKSGSPLP